MQLSYGPSLGRSCFRFTNPFSEAVTRRHGIYKEEELSTTTSAAVAPDTKNGRTTRGLRVFGALVSETFPQGMSTEGASRRILDLLPGGATTEGGRAEQRLIYDGLQQLGVPAEILKVNMNLPDNLGTRDCHLTFVTQDGESVLMELPSSPGRRKEVRPMTERVREYFDIVLECDCGTEVRAEAGETLLQRATGRDTSEIVYGVNEEGSRTNPEGLEYVRRQLAEFAVDLKVVRYNDINHDGERSNVLHFSTQGEIVDADDKTGEIRVTVDPRSCKKMEGQADLREAGYTPIELPPSLYDLFWSNNMVYLGPNKRMGVSWGSVELQRFWEDNNIVPDVVIDAIPNFARQDYSLTCSMLTRLGKPFLAKYHGYAR